MTRFLVVALFLGFTHTVFGQIDVVTSAYMDQKSGQLDKARTEIDKAILNAKTSVNAKTWFYRGSIYTDIAQSPIPALKIIDSNANRISYESFIKAMSLDRKEGEYYKSAQRGIEAITQRTFNEGVMAYQNKQYARAVRNYTIASEINTKDTTTLIYLAYAYEAMKTYDSVKHIYTKLFAMGHRNADMYRTLISYERAANNEAKALEIVQEGRKYYPNDKSLAIEELSLISSQGKLSEAKTKLEDAIKLDPGNASLYLALGSSLDKESADTKKTAIERNELKAQALANYQKVLEIDPNNADANFNIGVANFNEGVNITKKVNNMSMNDYNTKGKKLEADAKVWYQKALPYFEKVYSQQPADAVIRESLRKTYLNLGRKADAEKIPIK